LRVVNLFVGAAPSHSPLHQADLEGCGLVWLTRVMVT